MIGEKFKTEAEQKAEFEKSQKEQKRLKESFDKFHKHNKDRINEIEENKNNLFWELQPAGAGLFVQLDGLMGHRFLVPQEPKYKAVDNVIKNVVKIPWEWKEYGEPYSFIFEDSDRGDRIRNKILNAYKCAQLVYEYCSNNSVDIFHVAQKINPEYGTLHDSELLEFFKKELDKD